MKKIIIYFYLLMHLSGNAQIATLFENNLTDIQKGRTGLAADYFINASSFTTRFLNKFYKGGFIDTPLKDQVSSRTKNSNRVGAELNCGIFAAFRMDSVFHRNGFYLFFNVRDRQHVDAHFPKDFYNVAFYGNSGYAGKTADMNTFSFNLIRYQQFQVGLFSTKTDSAARWGIGLSFLKGEQYHSIQARKAQLFTSADGQYIDFDTEIEMMQSNPSNRGMDAFNGLGAGIDLFFEAPFQSAMGRSKLAVSVSDIGLIRFDEKSIYRKQDSLFHYTGFEIKSIFDLQNSIFLNTSQDSIQNKILPAQMRSVTATLPSTLNLSLETTFGKHFHLTEGVRYIFNANNKLLAYVKAGLYFKNIFLSATAGYGGYGNFNGGIGLGANLGAGFSIFMASQNLEGYFAPAKTAGQSAFFSIIKNFN